MDTQQIMGILTNIFGHDRKAYYDVIPCDGLQYISTTKFPIFLCVNDEPSGEPGSHWLGLHVPRPRGPLYFFCSYGMGINFYAQHFMNFANRLNLNVVENTKCLQSLNSSSCGYYVIYFLYKMSKGCCLMSVYHYFSKDVKSNDVSVEAFVKKYFKGRKHYKRFLSRSGNQCCTPFTT